MPDTVKTQVLKAVETLLAEIPELKTVARWRDIPTDLAVLEPNTPALFFWHGQEEREPFNRLEIGRLDINLAVFIKLASEANANDLVFQAFEEEAEIITALIRAKFAVPAALRAAGLIQVQELLVRQALASSLYGELFLNYELTYAHNKGDAFNVT